MDTYQNERKDPNLHQSDKQDPDPDPDPHQSVQLDPDLSPHQFSDDKPKCMKNEPTRI